MSIVQGRICSGGKSRLESFPGSDDEDVDVDDEDNPVITELDEEDVTALGGQGDADRIPEEWVDNDNPMV
jgi:hypothetical protein